MRKWIETWWPLVLCIAFWAVVAFLLYSFRTGLQKENEQLRQELALAQQYVPLKRDTIHDTVEVVTQKVVEVEKIKEVLTPDDRLLLKELGMKVKELESLQKTSVVTRDTVVLAAAQPLPAEKDGQADKNGGQTDNKDSVLTYKDAWTDFTYYVETGKLAYAVKDSLAIAVKQEYKHRFLWWKWGTKGYEVKVANFNPHASVRYNTFVKRRR